MKKLLLAVLVSASLASYSQTPASTRPKLVVGIVVDQMRPDYVIRFWNKFGNGGFRRILKDGYNCRNTQYNYAPTYTAPDMRVCTPGHLPPIMALPAMTGTM